MTVKQLGVFKGMATAMFVSLITISLAVVYDPFGYASIVDVSQRLVVLGLSLILPTFFLIASIGRLAKFRFFSPEDIDGSGLTQGSSQAGVLQSLLQNTLEQLVITALVYTAWCMLMPVAWLSAVPLCSVVFSLGRIGFFIGYHKGAPARAFGFALTFYSTVLLFVILVIYQLITAMS